jgi:hypothetical protein
MRLWVGRPVPEKPGQYDLRPVEVDYPPERLRRLNRFPLVFSMILTVLFCAAAVVLTVVPEEVGAGWALGLMAAGCVVAAAVFIRQLRQRHSMRRDPTKYFCRAYLTFDSRGDEVAFTEDELAERTGETQPCG